MHAWICPFFNSKWRRKKFAVSGFQDVSCRVLHFQPWVILSFGFVWYICISFMFVKRTRTRNAINLCHAQPFHEHFLTYISLSQTCHNHISSSWHIFHARLFHRLPLNAKFFPPHTSLPHATLSQTTPLHAPSSALAHNSFAHNTFTLKLFATVGPPPSPWSLPPFPVQLQALFEIFGRNWLVGLSGPLITKASLAAGVGFALAMNWVQIGRSCHDFSCPTCFGFPSARRG